MPQYEIKGSPISVIYGMNETAGIFMSVSDERLKPAPDASEQVNQIAKSGDVQGSYFEMHTGDKGPGLKVTKEAALVYLKRFGVSDEQVQTMLNAASAAANRKPVPEQKCHACQTLTTKSCQKCRVVFYCSKECQTGDWALHQLFCGLLPLPQVPKSAGKRVRGIYFPERSATPQVIFVPILSDSFRGRRIERAAHQQWIHSHYPYSVMMRENPYKGGAFLDDSIEFSFVGRDMDDGDFEPNPGVIKLTKGDHAFDWSGPIVVCKRRGLYDDDNFDIPYIDIEMSDFSNMRDFFKAYRRLPI